MYFIRLFVDIILGKYCSTIGFEIMLTIVASCGIANDLEAKTRKTLVYNIDGNNDNLIAT